ncbi:LysR family transcriptional regulator [Massilia sp. Root351]|uniref:LysR substrate-binding domain-containing protein n=1 Tax=Massilia sp. Root351 TaxID=1736522 RepID=UPI00070D9EB5|nr:LysR substrate-binding domain-containing protein [Massilia sp. Root351]KQV79314.1 LysR family transcriptional regulator [Massilia sp. Root351]
MYDLNDLQYFVMVIDHGGFAPTARALNIPRSSLGRRIALLEQRLGVRLIARNTRNFRVTELGHTYYAHCRAMLSEAKAAEAAVAMTHAEPGGLLRLSCPVTLLEVCVCGMVARFMAAHPRVQLHLESSDRNVDVVAEGVDIALCVRTPPFQDSELVARVLSQRQQCLVASPALVERLGQPRTPDDLQRFPFLHHGSPQRDYSWTLRGPDGTQAAIPHRPQLVTHGLAMLRSAAVSGVGVAQMSTALVHDHIARGELVQVLPDWAPQPQVIYAVFPTRRGMPPAARLLVDYLVAQFALLDDPVFGIRAAPLRLSAWRPA